VVRVIDQAVERVWLSGALWQSHPWEAAESALADIEKMSDRVHGNVAGQMSLLEGV
jgi:enoyl reductase-like protein